VTPPISRFRVDRVAAVRAAAVAIRQPDRAKTLRPITPLMRQATVVSLDATTPPSCTIQYDTVTPGPVHPLTRFAYPYVPVAGDVVYTVTLGNGDAWVLCKLAQMTPTAPPTFLRGTTTGTLAGGAGTFPTGTVAAAVSGSVSFPGAPLAAVPQVFLTPQIGGNVDVGANLTSAPTVNSFAWRVFARDPGTSFNGGVVTLHWLAIY
jgi:hypothetical protein